MFSDNNGISSHSLASRKVGLLDQSPRYDQKGVKIIATNKHTHKQFNPPPKKNQQQTNKRC